LVNHFQGRVSCRLGQTASEAELFTDPGVNSQPNDAWAPKCSIPGTVVDRVNRASKDNVNVPVPAQLYNRQTDDAVYCSCRCDGPDKKARYCECPEGFQCEPLVDDLKITEGGGQLPGSYCIRAGSKYNSVVHDKNGITCNSNTEVSDGKTAKQACGCGDELSAEDYPAECGAR
jgi:hypothetical protein